MKGWQTNEASVHPYFSLGDLWESFGEWSVYGVGSPVLLMDGACVKQYFAPYLSGIQLYIDPNKLRKTSGDSDAGSSRGTSTGSSDCVAEKRATSAADGAKPPHVRKPLCDKVSDLASYFPEIKTYRSCDLMPESWVSVAWYPIYSIPPGPTLQNLEASFLTFHCLSTHCRSKIQPQFHESTGRKGYGYDASPKISLPVFGLAFYKLRGSILTPNGESEWQQTNSLFQAAANWLQRLQVNLPDFQFFLSRWR
ncbi:Protein of unknown function (DUF789) [Quillaja saponaria]|uniref:Uncharacterized protein n=1 Tax=Quillaja saponaria TaxID=32244 RepID=A0AAD7VIX4_QUISA|nr:Protein of unknown function (DUF789) [Quillaja saponaria]